MGCSNYRKDSEFSCGFTENLDPNTDREKTKLKNPNKRSRKTTLDLDDIHDKVMAIPLVRKSTSFSDNMIVEIRVLHPRAYEPWTKDEIMLFKIALEQSSDSGRLSIIFGRQPSAIDIRIAKLEE